MTTRLTFALSELPVPMVFATHRIIRDCNDEFAGLFGYGRDELIDSSFSRLYPAIADFVRTGDMWRHHLPGGAVYYDERVMAAADGQRFWCRVNGRTSNASDPFAAALYCFELMARPVSETTLKLTGRQRQILALVARRIGCACRDRSASAMRPNSSRGSCRSRRQGQIEPWI